MKKITFRKRIINLVKSFGVEVKPVDASLKIIRGKSKFENLTFHPTSIANYYLPKNNESDTIAFYMKRGCFFEPEVIQEAAKHIKPGTTVLDIGANFGQMSLEFARLAGPKGKVRCFEAQQSVFNVLQKNIAANPDRNVEPLYTAIYNKVGETIYFPEPDFVDSTTLGSYGLNPKSQQGTPLKTITIDSLNLDEEISFIKVDVQGSDLFALQGAVNTIKRNQMPILFEFEEYFQAQFDSTFQDYVDFVASINYKFVKTIYNTNYLIMPK